MTAKELRASILDLAIRGKLVPQDPNDEPAEKLLARIAAGKAKLVKSGKLKKEKPLPPITDDDKPFGLPRGWVWCRLGEVCDSIADGDHQPPPQVERGVPFLVISNVSGGKLLFDKVRHVGESYFASLADNRKAGRGDILFTVTGSYGIPVVVDQDVDFCFQRHIALLKFKGIDLMYLYYGLSSALIKRQCDIVATGIAQKTVSISSLRNMILPLPPLAEQERIVEKIEQLMPLVERYGQAEEKRRQLIATLPEALKKSILKSVVEGKLVPQDPNDEPAEKLLARIAAEKAKLIKSGKLKKEKPLPPITEDEKPFALPHGWAWCRMEDVFEIARGGSPRPIQEYLTTASNGLNWIKIGDTVKGSKYINSVRERIRPEGLSKTRQVHRGDLLLTNSMSFGEAYILNVDGCIHDGWLVLHPRSSDVDREYFLYVLASAFVLTQFNDLAAGGIVQNLNSDKVKSLIVPIPPHVEQKRIVARVEELLGVVAAIKKMFNDN